jgi:hypothetical protein
MMRASETRVAWLALLWSCGGGTASQGATQHLSPSSSSANLVVAEELTKVAAARNLYEALQSLRPAWFWVHPTSRRPEFEGDIVVYLDDARLGGPETLKQVAIKDARVVRFLRPAEAEARFGQGNLHGVIQVSTKP